MRLTPYRQCQHRQDGDRAEEWQQHDQRQYGERVDYEPGGGADAHDGRPCGNFSVRAPRSASSRACSGSLPSERCSQ